MSLIFGLVESTDLTVIIATHSTALLGAVASRDDARVCLMERGATTLVFEPINNILERLIPVFGAHPLTNVFNRRRPLLVEGDDDERVWQQAVRSSRGAIAVAPLSVDGLPRMEKTEREVSRIIRAVYDDATAYSLRDLDARHGGGPMTDLGAVVRLRLNCRTIENLLLADDTLRRAGATWVTLREQIDQWLATNVDHPRHSAMSVFAGNGYDRQYDDVKAIRNLLLSLLDTNKPWEVLVGQAIADLCVSEDRAARPHSLHDYLGPKVMEELIDPLGAVA